jgi:uncharacterized membrane-anchored protein YhcB (DUF1043 family)
MIHEIINKLSNGLMVTISGGATIVSAFTLNDLGIIVGIITTTILAILNVLKYRHNRAMHKIEMEIRELELDSKRSNKNKE